MVIHGERLSGIDTTVVTCVQNISVRAETELGVDTLVVFGYRSLLEQDALYSQGRNSLAFVNAMRKAAEMNPITEKENIKVTKAAGGKSAHNFFAAVDLVALKDKKAEWKNICFFDIVRAEAEKLNLTNLWSIGDFGHIENKTWKNLST